MVIYLLTETKEYSFNCSKRKTRACKNCIIRFHCFSSKSGKKKFSALPEGILDPWVDIVLYYSNNSPETKEIIKILKNRAEYWHKWK